MGLKQILILALCLVACRARCYNETMLEERAQKMLQKHYPRPASPTASADTSTSCPLNLYQNLPLLAINDRSVSPWKYITVTRPDYYPKTYTEAKCLCSGCILVHQNGSVTQNFDYNTKALIHKSVFLKRVKDKCKPGKYRLVPERLEVSVGCICVRAQTWSS